ncbi:MAG: TatD family hydrolase [Candidatus Puniceispirillales bacterium]
MMTDYIIDTHAHLDFSELYDRLEEVLENAKKKNVKRIISISTNLNKIDKIINLSDKNEEVFFTVGIHPNEVLKDENNANYDLINDISKKSKCVGIGECGLDYHYGKNSIKEQKISFVTQINVARDTGLPLIIHSRDADKDMINLLTSEFKNGPFRAILHCFSSGKELALCGLDLGFYISFSGIVTFNSAKKIQEIAMIVPNDKILVETDSPYLAPTPLRGSINEPMNCYLTAKFLSNIRKSDFNKFISQLYVNSNRIFDKLY